MSYIQAVEFAEKFLGKDDGIYRNLSSVQKKFEEEYHKMQNRKCETHKNTGNLRVAVSPVRGASPPQKRAITATKGASNLYQRNNVFASQTSALGNSNRVNESNRQKHAYTLGG